MVVSFNLNSNVGKKRVPTIISEDFIISGNIEAGGEVHLDGKVKGDIRCQRLVVGITGSIEGEVRTDEACIHGSIVGKLYSKNVILSGTARMVGDIMHESLSIEPGAYIEGLCRRSNEPIPASGVKEDLMITDGRKESKQSVNKPLKAENII